mgnify:FL=1|jgi:2-polyprenyl-3-methyl-5-hydroxy-6-metoxy-1,4-benzoquinol methylase
MNSIKVSDCPACESKQTKFVFIPSQSSWSRFQLLSEKKYKSCMNPWVNSLDLKIKQCDNCLHLWHHTQPDFSSLLEMYDSSVALYKKSVSHDPTQKIIKSLKALYKLATKLSKSQPTFLDFGSGRGKWSKAAVIAGFKVWAYEPSLKRASDGYKDGFTIVSDISELNNLQFDVVNLEQVLEHTQNPFEIIKSLMPHLENKSIIRITTPNLGKYNSKKLWSDFPFSGNKMHVLSPYEHLQGFNSVSLRKLLSRVNLYQVNNLNVLRTHPVQQLRFFGGFLTKRIDTTSVIVSLNK